LQYAVRGAIIDIASVSEEHPIRLEFFGDELESLRYFDIATQTSFADVDAIRILPASDLIFTPEDLARLNELAHRQLEDDRTVLGYEAYEHLRTKTEADLARLDQFDYHHSLYKYLGFAQSRHFSILDYTPESVVLVANHDQTNTASRLLIEEAFDYFNELFEHGQLLSHLSMYRDLDRVLMTHTPVLANHPFQAGTAASLTLSVYGIVGAAMSAHHAIPLIEAYLAKTDKLVLAVATLPQLDLLINALKEAHLDYEQLDGLTLPKGNLASST
jgi:transcription-repair coupling factor (superfamily II helicase)